MEIRYAKDKRGKYNFNLAKIIFDRNVTDCSIKHAQKILDIVREKVCAPIRYIFVDQWSDSKIKVYVKLEGEI